MYMDSLEETPLRRQRKEMAPKDTVMQMGNTSA